MWCLALSYLGLVSFVSALVDCFSGVLCFFFFKQKTAYEMRISDWSSDVCSSDLLLCRHRRVFHLADVAEHGGGDGMAEVNVDAAPLALAVRGRKACDAAVDAALHEALGLDGVKGGAGKGRAGQPREDRKSVG